MIVYKITNKIDGKCYIGKTIRTLEQRIKCHIRSSKTSKLMFHTALNKYGIDNFKYTILEICMSIKEMNEKEIWYIKHFNSFGENGYNLTFGGDGNNYYKGKKFTEEHKKKLSESNKGKHNHIVSDLTRKKLSEACKKSKNGFKKHSEESKEKIRLSKLGKKTGPCSDQRRKNISISKEKSLRDSKGRFIKINKDI